MAEGASRLLFSKGTLLFSKTRVMELAFVNNLYIVLYHRSLHRKIRQPPYTQARLPDTWRITVPPQSCSHIIMLSAFLGKKTFMWNSKGKWEILRYVYFCPCSFWTPLTSIEWLKPVQTLFRISSFVFCLRKEIIQFLEWHEGEWNLAL